MSSEASESSGGINGMMSEVGGMLLKPCEWVDSIEDPTWRKIAAIGLDIAIIGIATGAFFAITRGHPYALMDPSWSDMIVMPILGLAGVGLGMLLEDILGEKLFYKFGGVATVVLPILYIGAAAALIGTAYVHAGGISGGMTGGGAGAAANYLSFGGAMLFAGSFFAVASAIDILGRKRPLFSDKPIELKGVNDFNREEKELERQAKQRDERHAEELRRSTASSSASDSQ